MSFNQNQIFAEKYAGCRAKCVAGMCPAPIINDDYECRVIGYDTRFIVVEFVGHELMYEVNSYISTIGDPSRKGWKVAIKDLIIIFEESLVSKLPKPYPHRCKICHSPSLNRGALIFCSNTKCKKAKEIRRRFYKPAIKRLGLDNENYVICPECSARSYGTSEAELNSIREMWCRARHKWKWLFEPGQRMEHFGTNYELGFDKKWIFLT